MNNHNIRQVTFTLKNEAMMKTTILIKGNLVCYSFNGEIAEDGDDPQRYLRIFSNDGNTVYLNGKEIGTLEADEGLADYTRELFQQHLQYKTFKEACEFIKGGVL